MVKEKGQRGDTGHTILETFLALFANEDRELTASNVGRIVENNTGKDRDGVRKIFQSLFLEKQKSNQSYKSKASAFISTSKRKGTTYYQLEIQNLLKLSQFALFAVPLELDDKEIESKFAIFLYTKLTKYVNQVVEYLRLWDPFMDEHYRIPGPMVDSFYKYGVIWYDPKQYPNEGLMKLKGAISSLPAYLTDRIIHESPFKFFKLIGNFESTVASLKNFSVTDVRYLLDHNNDREPRAGWNNSVPIIVRSNPIKAPNPFSNFWVHISDMTDIRMIDFDSANGDLFADYRWFLNIWNESCKRLLDSDERPKITDRIYPDVIYRENTSSYRITRWAGYHTFKDLAHGKDNQGLRSTNGSDDPFLYWRSGQ